MRFSQLSAVTVALAAGLAAGAGPAGAAATSTEIAGAVGGGDAVTGAELVGDPLGVGVSTAPVAGFPVQGGGYLVLSTGPAANVVPGSPDQFTSINLPDAAEGADGNDLTQLKLRTRPPGGATCVAFDFAFLSEEFPEWVGSEFNDIFTAELNDSRFELGDDQVVAPHNFAYDTKGNPVSINTVFGMSQVPGTVMDGATPALTATSPVERRPDGTMDVILSVQDLGDSILDSAVVVDNLRFGNGPTCAAGSTPLADADGDALPDAWEEHGLDVDRNGSIDLDLPAMGATKDHKDVFVEVDHMAKDPTCVWLVCWGGRDFAPQQSALDDVRAAFAAAPVPNPDGSTGIRAHIDAGPGSVMTGTTTWGARSRANRLAWTSSLGTLSASGDYAWGPFDALKAANFELARRDVFHYAVYGDTYGGSDSSGISRGIPASDFLVTDGHPGWGGGFTRTQERGTFLHELGHGLGLKHGGDLDTNPRPGYGSVMSYAFQLTGLPPGSRLDLSRGAPFEDWPHLRYDGGAIGARGATSTLPATTRHDEPGIDDFGDAFGRAGDGQARLVGPTVLLRGSGTARLLLDVTNAGPVADAFTVKATSPVAAIGGQATVTVPPGGTKRVLLPVATAGLAPGTVHVTVSLASTKGGGGLTGRSGDVKVVDGADPAARQAAQAALQQLAGLPAGSGPDPQLVTELTAALGSLGGGPTPAPTPSVTPTPAPTPSASASVTPAPSVTATPAPTPSVTATPSVTPAPTKAPTTGTPTCHGRPATVVGDGGKVIRGTKGDDVIVGTDAAEVVKGYGGDDVICALGGDDRIEAGKGDDGLDGGAGNDVLAGDDGRDTLLGGIGDDTLNAGDGDDVLRGGDGADTLRGSDGRDLLHGDAGDDVLRGEAGRDELHGDVGRDVVLGGDADDLLFGEEGADALSGNDGDDAMYGGPDLDTLSGGPGRNVLVQ